MASRTVDIPTRSAPSACEHPDLGGGLVAPAQQPRVDALGDAGHGRRGDGPQPRAVESVRSAKRGRTPSGGSGPVIGLAPVRLRWSLMTTGVPGPFAATSDPAALVSRSPRTPP